MASNVWKFAIPGALLGLLFLSGDKRRVRGGVNALKLPPDTRHHSLEGLHPEAKPYFEALIAEIKSRGDWPYISSAVRTFKEQAGLAGSGQSKVGCSWHQFGRAIDIDINGTVEWDPETYGAIGKWWEAKGPDFIWGGDFKSYGKHGDFVHFQYAPSLSPGPSLCGNRDDETLARYWADLS